MSPAQSTISRVLAATSRAVHLVSYHANRLASWWLIGALGLMAILIGAQVFCRYILNNSLFWSEEVGRILLVQISFLGASIAFKAGVHPSIRTFVDRLSPACQRPVQLFTLAISCAFFAVLAWYGVHFAAFISQQVTPSLGISKAIPVAVIPIASAISVIHALAHMSTLLDKNNNINQQDTQVTNIITNNSPKTPHPQDGGQS